MEVITTEKYKTIDGKVFKDKSKAREHEKQLQVDMMKKIMFIFYKNGIIDYDNGETFDKIFEPVNIEEWDFPWAYLTRNIRQSKILEYSKLLDIEPYFLDEIFSYELYDAIKLQFIDKETSYAFVNIINGIEEVIKNKKHSANNS